MPSIAENMSGMLTRLPPGVELVVAAKDRSAEEVRQAIQAGASIVGENYVKESLALQAALRSDAEKVRWHFIGYLQSGHVSKAVPSHDMIETLDSMRLAEKIDRKCASFGKTMPVLIEVNSAEEPQKHGVMPSEVKDLARQVAGLEQVKLQGLMTMGPFGVDPTPSFRVTKKLFDEIAAENIPGVEMRYLSMGMSDSYEKAIAEGANVVRIGTKIFGLRE